MQNVRFIKVGGKEEAATVMLERMRKELDEGLRVLGLATGSTMIPVYEAWAKSDLDFSEVISFNLDEYVGLGADNPNSYAWFMNHHLFSHKPFKETYIPDGTAEDLTAECDEYEALLRDAEIDLQFLGVGENGHIAFNEPGTPFSSTTHVTELADSTLGVNSQYFEDRSAIPNTALTMGIASILSAKKIVLLAFGEKKRSALQELVKGQKTTDYPITSLLDHPDVTIVTDLEGIAE
ncbi:glucosamine-6-phosphate deaminase [Edaphobacillus lindanitolerans]|uniref:Glucosamine-6-phosphate deaminase n=1 Tax=Edaphobacillus lindanitolerans TaxID=550447 RepID=A0A1U7PM63_9BACI|nr:glucosamine-6-phosphate deaminase [Edaphobacillus lindanitolerans]SIT69213.1 glucosamine-6-phosphate deaminase [Edaphobacillus lindanitolerans]